MDKIKQIQTDDVCQLRAYLNILEASVSFPVPYIGLKHICKEQCSQLKANNREVEYTISVIEKSVNKCARETNN